MRRAPPPNDHGARVPPTPTVHVRRIRFDEWEALRELRLRALADSPLAFGSTLAAERDQPAEFWQNHARRGAVDGSRATYVVVDERGALRGLATGAVDKDATSLAHLYSMYVDPPLRRGGFGRQLLALICDWARAGGMHRVILNVTETNAGAIRFYESCGFVPTGRKQPLSHTPSLLEVEMGREL